MTFAEVYTALSIYGAISSEFVTVDANSVFGIFQWISVAPEPVTDSLTRFKELAVRTDTQVVAIVSLECKVHMADETGIPPKLEAFLAGRSRLSHVELSAFVSAITSADGTYIFHA